MARNAPVSSKAGVSISRMSSSVGICGLETCAKSFTGAAVLPVLSSHPTRRAPARYGAPPFSDPRPDPAQEGMISLAAANTRSATSSAPLASPSLYLSEGKTPKE